MKGRSARASGGKAQDPESSNEKGVKVSDTDKGADWYSGETSNVKKEAEEKTGFKKGGKVSAFKRGKESEGMKIAGEKPKGRLDRPKRASGGAVSGSRDPFAMSAKTSERPGFKGRTDIAD